MKRRKKKSYIFPDAQGEEEYVVSNFQLDGAIRHLESLKNKNKGRVFKKGNCVRRERCAIRVERQAMLYCRQLPNVIVELRKAILRQEWKEVATLVMLLCQSGLTRHTSVIIRTCLLLLLNHHKSDIHLLEKFLKSCTGYMLDEDIRKFIKVLFALRDEPLPVLHVGKYIRSNHEYRVIDEICFKDL